MHWKSNSALLIIIELFIKMIHCDYVASWQQWMRRIIILFFKYDFITSIILSLLLKTLLKIRRGIWNIWNNIYHNIHLKAAQLLIGLHVSQAAIVAFGETHFNVQVFSAKSHLAHNSAFNEVRHKFWSSELARSRAHLLTFSEQVASIIEQCSHMHM